MENDMIKKKLKHVTLMLTYNCNMSCYMCGQVYSNRRTKEYSELPLEIIKKQIDSLDGIESVYIFGGEPLLYSRFKELVEYLFEKNIKILMTTNGVFLDKYIDCILDHVFDISLSFDSYIKEDFEHIRKKGTFDQVLRNMDLLMKARDKKPNKLNVGINCVIMKENYRYLLKIYDYISDKYPSINRINFEAPIYISEEKGRQNDVYLKNSFNCHTSTWKWFHNKIKLFNENEVKLIQEQIDKLENCKKATFLLPKDHKELTKFFIGKEALKSESCVFSLQSCTILPNGDVTFCVDFPDYIIGNVFENDLHNLFYGEKAEQFRNCIREKGNMPICERCPRIFNENNSIV